MKCLLAVLLATVASVSWANIGSVTESTGVASIKRGKETIQIAKGTVIEMNDKVETKSGRVKIVFKDDTTVTVTESSALVIDDFVYDPKSGAGKLGLKAAAGTVRYVSGSIAKDPKNVKINTPTAAIAVRGTDFVMAVGETGSSMIMLMPTCEIEGSVNLKGLTCGSGAIDVETPAGIVKMNRPYQATLVETAGAMPSPPIIVNLGGMPVGSNLLINPPKTMSGVSVVAAARAAADKTGDLKDKKDDAKDDAKDVEKQQAASRQDSPVNRATGDNETKTSLADAPKSVVEETSASQTAATTSETENPYLFKLWKDKSETTQVGWMYETLSPNGRNYANVVQPMGTQVLIFITQDMQSNSYSFVNKPIGQIVINQSYR